jgi:hypothetical protein
MATPGHWGGGAPPQAASEVARGLWGWGWLPLPCPIFFSFFFLKKISIFIYFLINLYYFIKMCMSAPRVANKMALT